MHDGKSLFLFQALCTRGSYIVLIDNIDHGASYITGEGRKVTERKYNCRQQHMQCNISDFLEYIIISEDCKIRGTHTVDRYHAGRQRYEENQNQRKEERWHRYTQ